MSSAPRGKRPSLAAPTAAVTKRRKKDPTDENGTVAQVRSTREPAAVFVVGDGVSGQLGLGMDVTEKTRPVAVPGLTNVIDVAAGGMHTVCLTSDHKVITFGCNDEGALGRDTSEEGSEAEPGPVSVPGKVVQISAGDSHTAALLDSGHVYVWGAFRDNHGPMGLFTTTIEKKPVLLDTSLRFKKIVSGSHHLVLLTTDGDLITLGCGEQGQLGRLPERAATRDTRRGLASLLSPSPVKRPTRTHYADVWTGCFNTFALDTVGTLHVWGLNNYKQLGTDSNLRYYPTTPSSFKGLKWIQLAGGMHHTLALSHTGEVYVLGRKDYGILGLGENCNEADVPTRVNLDQKCVAVSCGSYSSFALLDDGRLFSWGQGGNWLGVGDEDDHYVPTLVKGRQLENKRITQVQGGGQHTVILVRENSP